MDYAGLGKRLTLRMLTLLAVVSTVEVVKVLIDAMPYRVWAPFSPGVVTSAGLCPVHSVSAVYEYFRASGT